MTTPAVVEKQVVDISLDGGLDEYTRPENMDWTKHFKVADNVDFAGNVAKVRPGLMSVSATATPLYRCMSTGTGVLAIGAGFKGYQLDESSASGAVLTPKNTAAEYSVTPTAAGGINAVQPYVVGAAYTSRYNVLVYQLYNAGVTTTNDFRLVILDKQSGNVVRNLLFTTVTIGGLASAVMTVVANRYIHLYIGYVGTCSLYQIDTDSLPIDVPTGVVCTSGNPPIACCPNATTSVVLMGYSGSSTQNLSRFSTAATPVETATGSTTGTAQVAHDMDTDGTSFYVVGRVNSPSRGMLKVLGATFSTTRTVTDTDSTLSAARFSVAVKPSTGDCYLLGHHKSDIPSSVAITHWPTTRVLSCASAASVFTTIQVIPATGQVGSPFYNSTRDEFYAPIIDLPMRGDDTSYNGQDGHNVLTAGGACVLMSLSGTKTLSAKPVGFHVACVLDQYVDYVGNNSTSTGALGIFGVRPFTSDAGLTVVMGAVQQASESSFSAELRTLKLYDSTVTGCSTDVVSGGKTCVYDGLCLSEMGCYHTPGLVAADQGAGSSQTVGIKNYVLVFEFADAMGRRHLSRCSNPWTLNALNTHDVNLYITYPVLTDHMMSSGGQAATVTDSVKYHVYRTVVGDPFTYHRVISGVVNTSTTTDGYITVLDQVTDILLASQAEPYKQPGTPNAKLDRYVPLASSCVTRHKDMVFYARGSDVYFSGQAVFGESPWFNPIFSFNVPGGTGPITAISSLDSLLVIFKKNAIFVVDGDGPPDTGGNGTEFSPPRRLITEYGCVDQRTVLRNDSGLMFKSAGGIQQLTRKLTVEWIGKSVDLTVTNYPYCSGAAFDPTSGRAVWLCASAAGTYPGQVDYATGTGYAVVYDTYTNAWSRYKLRSTVGYGSPFQDVCYANAGSTTLSVSSADRLVFADNTSVWLETGTVDHGSVDNFIPIELQTGWVKPQSKADRMRITDLFISAHRNADCTLAVSYASDYSSSYTSVKTWTPSVTGSLSVVQLSCQPPVESVESMSFKIVTSDPTPTSFGAGTQFDIFGLSLKVGLKGGGVKLPAAQKG